MQSNIIEFKQPAKTQCECVGCGNKWEIVYPITQDDLECDKCESDQGVKL